MSSTKSALKNSAWLFGEKGAAMALSLSVNVLLARYLQPENFGVLNYLSAFMALLIPFASLGLNALVTRELVNKSSMQGTILATALSTRFFGALLALFLVVIVVLFISFQSVLADKWFVLAALANCFTTLYLFDFYFQSKVASRYVVKVRLVVLAISSVAKLAAIYFELPLSWFLVVVLLEPVLIGLGFFTAFNLYKKTHEQSSNNLQWQVNKQYGFELLKESRWLILSGFMAVIYLKVDLLMLGQLANIEQVGFYAVAARLSEVWYFFPGALVASFFPKLLKLKHAKEDEEREGYNQQLQKLCDYLFSGALILAIVTSFAAHFVIVLLFGEQYQPSAVLLQIHIWAGIFIFMRALLSKWLIAEHLLKFSLLTHGIAALVNVSLNYYWIPIYGAQGAAWATLISYATSSYFVLWLNKSTRVMAWIMTKAILFPFRIFTMSSAETYKK